ncbi:MAG: bifunctional demethylmenaquinone methyltransferase/2-methoxy-6-polyprenyl-1,4-benzoquinol methylase UbiE [Thioalkalivibrionaceae bacterium]
MQHDDDTTHFGYESVQKSEKASRVGAVFHSVARRYDVMNDVMSMGIHRLWKRMTVEQARARPGHRVLDLAGGTGDLARAFLPRVGEHGEVVVCDINASMLGVGRDRLLDEGAVNGLRFVQGNAECLPFPDRSFDRITIAFGLRNVTDKDAALVEMHRVLKPGGKLLVLEFSRPAEFLRPAYDLYSFKFLPLAGKIVANDAASYRYLAESIRMHPDQDTLADMMRNAGFERVDYTNMSAGIVALHEGVRL